VRVTFNLDPAVHKRAVALSKARGESLSVTIASLVEQGLRSQPELPRFTVEANPGSR
jgi:hypothetical protein